MQKLIIANWKMNTNIKFIDEFMSNFKRLNNLNEVIICPPSPYLLLVKRFDLSVKLGSQDISIFDGSGSFTGEVSGLMLKDCFVEYVIIGHSERRNYFFEDDIIIEKKLSNCISNSLNPILCVGEDLDNRNNMTYKEFILKQLQVIKKFKSINNIIIAYEPIWAIGTGKNANLEQIQEVHEFIFKSIDSLKLNNLKSLKIIYGGSVNKLNYTDILSLDYVDGVLVGKSSLNIDNFIKMANYKSCLKM